MKKITLNEWIVENQFSYRKAYGFEIKKDFYNEAKSKILSLSMPKMFCEGKKPKWDKNAKDLSQNELTYKK